LGSFTLHQEGHQAVEFATFLTALVCFEFDHFRSLFMNNPYVPWDRVDWRQSLPMTFGHDCPFGRQLEKVIRKPAIYEAKFLSETTNVVFISRPVALPWITAAHG
jgi:hypothetical protein